MSYLTLVQLEQIIRGEWCAETAWTPSLWTQENPAAEQCFSTAYVVQQLLGGEIVHAEVYPYAEPKHRHAWNRLPSGIEVDLTREQFPADQILLPCELPSELVWKYGGKQAAKLLAKVRSRLEEEAKESSKSSPPDPSSGRL